MELVPVGALTSREATDMLYLGVLSVVPGVGPSIALHEIGYLVPAKRFGVRVPQHMVGFWPTLWSMRSAVRPEIRRQGHPARWLCAHDRDVSPKPGQGSRHRADVEHGTVQPAADEARNQSLSELQPGDERRRVL